MYKHKYCIISSTKQEVPVYIAILPDKDRAMAVGNTHEKYGEAQTCGCRSMQAERRTRRQTDRHAHHNTPLPYWGGLEYNDCKKGTWSPPEANDIDGIR